MNLSVLDAIIFTSKDYYTLNTFLVLEADGSQLNDEERITELKDKLTQYIKQTATTTSNIEQHIPRAAKHFKFPTRVSFENNEIQKQTMMKVIAYDRPGILTQIGTAMHSCKIRLHKAKVATYGEKAEDIFFITNENGKIVSSKEQLNCLEKTIIEGLDN